jgi:hypothetical protein
MEIKEDNKKTYTFNKKKLQNLKSILQAIHKKETAKMRREPTVFSLRIRHFNTQAKHNYHKTHNDVNGTIQRRIIS